MPHLHTLFTLGGKESCPPKAFEFSLIADDVRYFGSDAFYSTEHFESYMMDIKAAFKRTNYQIRTLIEQVTLRLLARISATRIRHQMALERGPRRGNTWTIERPFTEAALKFFPSDLASQDSPFVNNLVRSGLAGNATSPCKPS